MKGRIALVFWLVVVLAVLTATASYAWLAMNRSANARGLEVEAISDSMFLEVSAKANSEYSDSIQCAGAENDSESVSELFLISSSKVPNAGAYLIDTEKLNEEAAKYHGTSEGKYNGTGRFYIQGDSVIGKGPENYYDITATLTPGVSDLAGYYVLSATVRRYPVSTTNSRNYYVAYQRSDGSIDYACIGKFEVGETIGGRTYWGFANSNDQGKPEPNNVMNVVSLDFPEEPYCLKHTVYLRGAHGTIEEYNNLRISSVNVRGLKSYLTDAIRILFVATAGDGTTVMKTYSYRHRDDFDGYLFDTMLGNGQETVSVDIYIYFDGKDESATNLTKFLTVQTIGITFAVKDLEYN